jgi:hypothetical protein
MTIMTIREGAPLYTPDNSNAPCARKYAGADLCKLMLHIKQRFQELIRPPNIVTARQPLYMCVNM